MLREYRASSAIRQDYEQEVLWLGSSFTDFLVRIPKHHLLNQLWMFSRDYAVGAAYDRITSLDYYVFVERFDEGIAGIARKLKLPLRPLHIRKTSVAFEPSEVELSELRNKLEPEIELYERRRRHYDAQHAVN